MFLKSLVHSRLRNVVFIFGIYWFGFGGAFGTGVGHRVIFLESLVHSRLFNVVLLFRIYRFGVAVRVGTGVGHERCS